MKNIKNIIIASCFAVLSSCGQKNGDEKAGGSGSETQTTPNDSSGTESKKALGVGEGNQKEVGGYPSNQSNLNSDSTSKLHDPDTTSKKPAKDKPNKHQ